MPDNKENEGQGLPPEQGRSSEQRAGDLWRLLNDGASMDEGEDGALPALDKSSSADTKAPEEKQRFYDDARPDGYNDLDVDSIELRRPVAQPDPIVVPADYDPAVHEYVSDKAIAVQCKNHPLTDAVAVCPNCEAYFCQPCLVIHRGKLVCRECRSALDIRTEEEVLSMAEGEDNEELGFVEKEKPEFQAGGLSFGLEGRPASPLKRLIALFIDFMLIRGTILILLLLLDHPLSSIAGPTFQLFEPDDGFESPFARIFKALVLMQPFVPWLLVFFVTDFLYYFVGLSFTNRTLGMSWTGCRIVTEWGDFVPFSQVALRSLVFVITLGWPAILLSYFFPAHRGPHDYAAGTVVINYDGVKRIDAYETLQIKL